METLTYTELSQLVHGKIRAQRVPVDGTIEVTNRCPLVCSHCYNNLPMNDTGARSAELTLDEHRRLADEIADLGCLWLLYTGGEIFARRDFLDIYSHAKSKGLLITLFTNGILIDERIADRLAELPPFSIEITLYGNTPATYEALTRIPGSYARCRRGIDLILERGLPLKLKTVAVATNKHEIFDMKAFADSLGVGFKFDAMISPRIDCSSAPLGVRLDPADVVELDLRDPQRVAEYKDLAVDLAPPVVPEGETPQVYDCGGGINSWAVDPYGNLSICVLSHFDRFNLRNGSFAEGWNGLLQQVRTKTITHPTKCTNCAIRSMCGMCAANGELENGDPEAPVDFLCRTAHLRAEAFGIEVPPHGDCEYCGEKRETIVTTAAALHERVRTMPMVPGSLSTPSSCGGGGCTSCHAR